MLLEWIIFMGRVWKYLECSSIPCLKAPYRVFWQTWHSLRVIKHHIQKLTRDLINSPCLSATLKTLVHSIFCSVRGTDNKTFGFHMFLTEIWRLSQIERKLCVNMYFDTFCNKAENVKKVHSTKHLYLLVSISQPNISSHNWIKKHDLCPNIKFF